VLKVDKKKQAKDKKDHKKTDKEQVKELTETLQHLQADFENYKKQVDKEKGEFLKYAKASLIESLLPIIDNFEMALKSNSDHEKFLKGMELVYSQFYSILEKEGIRKIEALNKPLDPFKHEVMLTVDSEKEGIVLEELQTGYMLNEKVLRHSKVKVGKKKAAKNNDNQKDHKEKSA